MNLILNTTAPIFLLIFIGYTATRAGIIPKNALPGMSKFVLYLSLPALIFSKLSVMPISNIINFEYMSAYAVGCLGALIGSLLFSLYVTKTPALLSCIKSLGSAQPNSAFIGLPVMLQFFTTPVTQAFAMVLLVENILIFPLGLAMIEMANQSSSKGLTLATFKPIAAKILKNPIIQGVFISVIFSVFNLRLPDFATTALAVLGSGATPLALIIIGGSLVGVSIRANVADIALVSGFKLVVAPILTALTVLLAFPDMQLPLKQAVILFAAIPMFSTYPIIGGQYNMQAFCSAALLVTTVLAFFSVSTVLFLIQFL